MTRPDQTEGSERQSTGTVGIDRAMRARDVSRPTPKEMAETLRRLGKSGKPPAQRTPPNSDGASGGSTPVSS